MPALIGLDKLHYSILATDDISTGKASYGTPVRIPGAVGANINPNSSMDTLFADNGPMETATSLGKVELELTVAEFTPMIQAAILGHAYIGGMLVRKSSDVPPWIAVGGRALKSNGAYRYFWLLKGKMSPPEQKNETKKDKVSFQTPAMKGEFVKRDCDDFWIVEYDTDSAEYDPAIEANWFTKVMSLDDLPLGCTITPIDGATNVAVSSSVIVKFSKAITDAVATTGNFAIVKDSDSSAVVSTVTLSSDKLTVTVTPSAALTAATKYNFTVKAVTGITADRVISFTTA
jgi:phi13 family phage major tail protein